MYRLAPMIFLLPASVKNFSDDCIVSFLLNEICMLVIFNIAW